LRFGYRRTGWIDDRAFNRPRVTERLTTGEGRKLEELQIQGEAAKSELFSHANSIGYTGNFTYKVLTGGNDHLVSGLETSVSGQQFGGAYLCSMSRILWARRLLTTTWSELVSVTSQRWLLIALILRT